MKKFLLSILIILMCGFLITCVGDQKNDENGKIEKDDEEDEEDDDGGDIIVDDDYGEIEFNRIYIENKLFMVDGKRIWINGANTPWNKWDEFGSNENWNEYDNNWWDNEFARLKNAGINATRIWISCKNDAKYNPPISINSNGKITGIREKFWTDLDKLFNLATKHKIYIMATLISFDHFKQQEPWQKMIKDKDNVHSFAEHYTLPFVKKYRDNPYLWSIDICNEIEWIFEGDTALYGNPKPTWAQIQYFLAYNAAVIHSNSNILVTAGFASVKYNGADSQRASDSVLKAQFNNPKAHLDFWSPHYYEWVGEWYGVPFYLTPSGAISGNNTSGFSGGWRLDGSKPAVIGECSAMGTSAKERGWVASGSRPPVSNTIITDFQYAYNNGWQGVMPWTSNGADVNGNLNNFKSATEYMRDTYREIIFPSIKDDEEPNEP